MTGLIFWMCPGKTPPTTGGETCGAWWFVIAVVKIWKPHIFLQLNEIGLGQERTWNPFGFTRCFKNSSLGPLIIHPVPNWQLEPETLCGGIRWPHSKCLKPQGLQTRRGPFPSPVDHLEESQKPGNYCYPCQHPKSRKSSVTAHGPSLIVHSNSLYFFF